MAPTCGCRSSKLSPHHVALVSATMAVEQQNSAISLSASGVGIDRAAPSNYCIETQPTRPHAFDVSIACCGSSCRAEGRNGVNAW